MKPLNVLQHTISDTEFWFDMNRSVKMCMFKLKAVEHLNKSHHNWAKVCDLDLNTCMT